MKTAEAMRSGAREKSAAGVPDGMRRGAMVAAAVGQQSVTAAGAALPFGSWQHACVAAAGAAHVATRPTQRKSAAAVSAAKTRRLIGAV